MNAVIVALDRDAKPAIRIHCDDRSELPNLARMAARVVAALAETTARIDPSEGGHRGAI